MNNEKMDAKENFGATVSRGGNFADLLGLRGVYVATCIAPLEQFRKLYIQLRDDLIALQDLAIPTAEDVAHMRELEKQIADIPVEVKWETSFKNLVTDVGANDILDKYLAGSAYTADPYMGLKNNDGAPDNGDTMVTKTNSWTEYTNYSEANRPTPAFSAASSRSKATSSDVTFSINGAGGTVGGAFIVIGGNNTKGNTTGVLVTAGNFSSAKTVTDGDTLNVSYSLSV